MSEIAAMNYDREAGDLLQFVSRIAIKIRAHAWSRRPVDEPDRTSLATRGVEEIELLSDAIHNVSYLGAAMIASDHAEVEDWSGWHIEVFSSNSTTVPDSEKWANPAMMGSQFWDEGVRIFTAIRDKARLIGGAASQKGDVGGIPT